MSWNVSIKRIWNNQNIITDLNIWFCKLFLIYLTFLSSLVFFFSSFETYQVFQSSVGKNHPNGTLIQKPAFLIRNNRVKLMQNFSMYLKEISSTWVHDSWRLSKAEFFHGLRCYHPNKSDKFQKHEMVHLSARCFHFWF